MESRDIVSLQGPLGANLTIKRKTFSPFKGTPVKRISFVAGLHGDELEGVYLCHRLIEYLTNLRERRPESFKGEINIYPALNPQALDAGCRLWPFFSVDMNRQFGSQAGDSLPARITREVFDALQSSSDIVVDCHASNLQLKELPQIRIIKEFEKDLVPLAEQCNIDLIWVHPMAPIFESTLGYNLNRAMVSTLVIETGICLRIDPLTCDQLLCGMIHLLQHTKILDLPDPPPEVKQPILAKPSDVTLIQAGHSGLFVSSQKLGSPVKKGDLLGKILNPVAGTVLETLEIPRAGLLFTLREHPLTFQGAPVGRIVHPQE